MDIKSLIEQLAEQINEGFAGNRRDVRIVVDVPRHQVPGDFAVPLALFTVEALTNVFKHAFPPGRGGTVRVSLTRLDGGMQRLAVEDDGIGFDYADADASVGARLIRTFGQQISGVADIRSTKGNGTSVEIVFPDPEAMDSRAAQSSPEGAVA